MNGGSLDISAQFAFDFDYGSEYNGGTIIVNGSVVNDIANSMMGGHGGPGGFGGPGGGR